LKHQLGNGSFGVVFGGICKETGKKVAIKKVKMHGSDKTKQAYYEKELIIL
jgi:serine/threonine protein kinase